MTIDRPYAAFCGPRAVGVLAGIGRYRAASQLARVQRLRGIDVTPGTPLDDALIVLSWHGLKAEPWSTSRDGARPIETAQQHDARLRRELRADHAQPTAPEPERARAFVLSLPAAERTAAAKRYRAACTVERYTLREWLRRAGTWLVSIDATLHEGDFRAHMLALADGRVLAGDDERGSFYGDVPIIRAYRIEGTRETTWDR